jgi:hypothetical protein
MKIIDLIVTLHEREPLQVGYALPWLQLSQSPCECAIVKRRLPGEADHTRPPPEDEESDQQRKNPC